MLRKLLALQFVAFEDPKKFAGWRSVLSLERAVDDFVFICMFVGNDFLPHVAHLDISDGSLNMMMNAYRDLLPSLGGFLTDKTRVHLPRLELFMREVARYEPHYFERRAREEKNDFDASAYAGAYYEDKFGWGASDPETPRKRRQLVADYVAGLYWVLE
jgi:5'-3' exonuclease